MEIKRITIKDYDAYTELIIKFGSTVFNSSRWLAIYESANLIPFGIYNGNNELIGGFVLYKTSKFGFTFYCNPPFMPHIGLFFENRATNKSKQLTFQKSVMQLMVNYFNALPYKLFTVALPVGHGDTQPFFWNKYKVVPSYTYRINLQNTEDELFNHMTPEKRNSIKKATKDKVIISRVSDYKLVKELVLKTFSRRQKELDEVLLNKILFNFANPDNSFAFVAFKDTVPIATTFCIFDQEKAYYSVGGYNEAEKHHGAGSSCMWQSILHAQSIGLKIFDFEGSMLIDIERYFREFGGDLTPYYTINKAWLPFEIGLKFIKRQLF